MGITALDQELAGNSREIDAAENDLKAYEGGVLVAFVHTRIETLKLTRAILQKRIAADKR